MVFVPLIKLSGSSNIRKSFYFCIAISGYSAARLAHLVWDQRAVCSNHTTPTQEKARPAFKAGTGFNFSERRKLAFASE